MSLLPPACKHSVISFQFAYLITFSPSLCSMCEFSQEEIEALRGHVADEEHSRTVRCVLFNFNLNSHTWLVLQHWMVQVQSIRTGMSLESLPSCKPCTCLSPWLPEAQTGSLFPGATSKCKVSRMAVIRGWLRLALTGPTWKAGLLSWWRTQVTLCSALTSHLWLSCQSSDSFWIGWHCLSWRLPLHSVHFWNAHWCKCMVPALMELIAQ